MSRGAIYEFKQQLHYGRAMLLLFFLDVFIVYREWRIINNVYVKMLKGEFIRFGRRTERAFKSK